MKSYRDILRQYWGYDDFRGIQREIIESIGSGHDTLGLMPTGGGKSITFQVPALAQEGTCLVITPLVALMKDQVQALRSRGIRAAAIHSGLAHDDVLRLLDNAVFGAVKLLYVSPERLSSPLFRKKVLHMHISFICVDEAHCICQWGYDFRPSYLKIADLREDLPGVPVLALTATATPDVAKDIQDKLAPVGAKGPDFNVFRMSFERKNLSYVVCHTEDKPYELVHSLQLSSGSAIVYTRSRKRTCEVARLLTEAGISATWFHAGLDNAEKDLRQQQWQKGKVRVMVATNAFGMGIDKADVRLVVHIDCPDSLEAYFQEAGRAGRDGQPASAILLCDNADRTKLNNRIGETYPEKDYIRDVYDHLAYFYQIAVGSGYNATFEFPTDRFCRTFRFFPVPVESALKILTNAGYIEYTEERECLARVMFLLERDELYRLHGNTADEDKVIEALMRLYTGLFVDFQFVDETELAHHTGLSRPQVYLTLKQLSQKRILQFVPQKRTPYIRFTQRREESAHLLFPPAVYDDLRQRYARRIGEMIAYAFSDAPCRSQQLLSYFGETDAAPCGHCDVCLSSTPAPQAADAASQITQLLADGQPHPIEQLRKLRFPTPDIEAALLQLLNDGTVVNDDGLLLLEPAQRLSTKR